MCVTHIIARKITNNFLYMQARAVKNKKKLLFAIFIAKKRRGIWVFELFVVTLQSKMCI